MTLSGDYKLPSDTKLKKICPTGIKLGVPRVTKTGVSSVNRYRHH